MKSLSFFMTTSLCVALLAACSTPSPQQMEALKTSMENAFDVCQAAPPSEALIVEGPNPFVLNVKICTTYTGDGLRPLDPRRPTPEEAVQLVEGEVYFVAILKDLGSDMQKITIQSDVMKKIIRSKEYIYNYDLYYGSPTGALEIYVGVFDDDGWPSDRTEKLQTVQDNLGTALEAFPQAAVAIPFLQPILDAIPALMDFVDPDDSLLAGKAIVARQEGADGKIIWKLTNPVIKTDNGTIILTIQS